MLRKVIYAGVGLTAAAVGPAAYYSASDYLKAGGGWLSPAGAPTRGAAAPSPTAARRGLGPPSETQFEGAPVRHLAEVLRFDVTADWVLSRWPRVSTGLAQPQLHGYRVPLVTGTAESDLAGALTYYFNARQEVQRITFHGATGDARKLIHLLTTRYRFARRPANDPGLAVYEYAHPDGKRLSALRITSAGVVKSSDPYRRYAVDLIMERPS